MNWNLVSLWLNQIWNMFLNHLCSCVVMLIHIHLLIITMTDRIMHSERHAEYNKQENEVMCTLQY